MFQAIYYQIGSEVDVFRFYKSKRDNSIKLSKFPQFSFTTYSQSMSSCRETQSSLIRDNVYRASTLNDKSYCISTLASAKTKSKTLINNGTIIFQYIDLDKSNLSKITPDTEVLEKTLNYIVGIMSVCLVNGDDELLRRENGKGLSSKCLSRSDFFCQLSQHYGAYWRFELLSPFW